MFWHPNYCASLSQLARPRSPATDLPLLRLHSPRPKATANVATGVAIRSRHWSSAWQQRDDLFLAHVL
ncbi:MAG: hypothetical protein C4297_00650 [Gemmataceae bacterium]